MANRRIHGLNGQKHVGIAEESQTITNSSLEEKQKLLYREASKKNLIALV